MVNKRTSGQAVSHSSSYFHHDHLGSIAAITDETGAVKDRLAFDPWGKRRFILTKAGWPDTKDEIVGLRTDRGYTMHEELDEVGAVHMNGRVYDPLIGRFMTADSIVPNPSALQSFNRYGYVFNNPLRYTDPDGHEPWGPGSNWGTGPISGVATTGSGAPNSGVGSGLWTSVALSWTSSQRMLTFVGTDLLGSGASIVGQVKSGYLGENASVLIPETGFETAGRYTRGVVDFARDFMPGSSFPDAGAAAGQGRWGLAAVLLGTEVLGPLGKGARVAAGLEKAAAKGVREYSVVQYRPVSAGLENHHGVLDVWATHNVPGYVSRAADSPTIALSSVSHDATKVAYRDWLATNYGKAVGARVDWTNVSAREALRLSERMFDAGRVPMGARSDYYRAFNQYIYGGR